jgi:hypothetical protein
LLGRPRSGDGGDGAAAQNLYRAPVFAAKNSARAARRCSRHLMGETGGQCVGIEAVLQLYPKESGRGCGGLVEESVLKMDAHFIQWCRRGLVAVGSFNPSRWMKRDALNTPCSERSMGMQVPLDRCSRGPLTFIRCYGCHSFYECQVYPIEYAVESSPRTYCRTTKSAWLQSQSKEAEGSYRPASCCITSSKAFLHSFDRFRQVQVQSEKVVRASFLKF